MTPYSMIPYAMTLYSMTLYCMTLAPPSLTYPGIPPQMLERLSAEEEDTEEYLTVPPLGKHYTLRWAEEDGRADGESGDDSDSKSSSAQTKSKRWVMVAAVVGGIVSSVLFVPTVASFCVIH